MYTRRFKVSTSKSQQTWANEYYTAWKYDSSKNFKNHHVITAIAELQVAQPHIVATNIGNSYLDIIRSCKMYEGPTAYEFYPCCYVSLTFDSKKSYLRLKLLGTRHIESLLGYRFKLTDEGCAHDVY